MTCQIRCQDDVSQNKRYSAQASSSNEFSIPSSRAAKVRGAQLPSQYLLVRFVSNITGQDITWNSDADACTWKGVHCNGDFEVKYVLWPDFNLHGTPCWKYLPSTTRTVDLSNVMVHDTMNILEGSVPLYELPHAMEILVLRKNKFSNELDLSHMPRTMLTLDVLSNCLEGSAELEQLPGTMSFLNLSRNQMSGSLQIDLLPSSMKELYVSHNLFSGNVVLTSLPSRLTVLCLEANRLHGSIDLSCLPKCIIMITLDENHFSGHVDLTTLPRSLKIVRLGGNSISSYTPVPAPICVQI